VVLGLACWPLVPKIAGSNPPEAVGFFRQKNPEHAKKSRLSHVEICVTLKNPVIYVEVSITGQINWPFLTRKPHLSLTEVSDVACCGAPLEMMGGIKIVAQGASSL
jgi:hypothetical protein